MVVIIGGIHNTVLWEEEGTYGEAYSTTDNLFGIITDFTPTYDNSITQSWGLGARATYGTNAGTIKCGCSISFEVMGGDTTNAGYGWMAQVLGVTRSGSGTAVSKYSYDTVSGTASIKSIRIGNSFELGTTDANLKIIGAYADSCTIEFAENEPVKVTLDYVAQSMSKGTTAESQTAVTGSPHHMVHASIEMPDGAAITDVTKVGITIKNNAKSWGGIGSRTGATSMGKREITGRISLHLHNAAQLALLLGSATTPSSGTPASTSIDIVTTAVGDANHNTNILLGNVRFKSLRLPQALDGAIDEEYDFVAEDITVTEQVTA